MPTKTYWQLLRRATSPHEPPAGEIPRPQHLQPLRVPRQRVHPPTTAQIPSHTALPHHAPPQETRRRHQETRSFPSTDLKGSKTRPMERG